MAELPRCSFRSVDNTPCIRAAMNILWLKEAPTVQVPACAKHSIEIYTHGNGISAAPVGSHMVVDIQYQMEHPPESEPIEEEDLSPQGAD